MPIDYCLILAAGFGTRMGEIGKHLPKVMWPVFEKTLLELQVAYARSLGIKNIYINLHYMGETIEKFCRKKSTFEGVQLLWEKPEILDIGGAIHQLARLPEVKYKGRLLVLNADQFFYIPPDRFMKYVQASEKAKCTLFNYWVNTDLGYNAILVDDKRIMQSIVKNKDLPLSSKVETYTGISIINLNQLRPVEGVSSFFESVCLFKNDAIPTIILEDIDYWDFGTLKRYWETSFKILETYRENSNHPFIRFLVGHHALKTWKIDLKKASYHAISPGVINLGTEKLGTEMSHSIILNNVQKSVTKNSFKTVWWSDICEELKS
jgi:mannose-1-phosphate guanylyltransferase